MTLTARNLALSEQANPGQDVVATCAACWLSTRETSERLNEDADLMKDTNNALAAAGLNVKAVFYCEMKLIACAHLVTFDDLRNSSASYWSGF